MLCLFAIVMVSSTGSSSLLVCQTMMFWLSLATDHWPTLEPSSRCRGARTTTGTKATSTSPSLDLPGAKIRISNQAASGFSNTDLNCSVRRNRNCISGISTRPFRGGRLRYIDYGTGINDFRPPLLATRNWDGQRRARRLDVL